MYEQRYPFTPSPSPLRHFGRRPRSCQCHHTHPVPRSAYSPSHGWPPPRTHPSCMHLVVHAPHCKHGICGRRGWGAAVRCVPGLLRACAARGVGHAARCMGRTRHQGHVPGECVRMAVWWRWGSDGVWEACGRKGGDGCVFASSEEGCVHCAGCSGHWSCSLPTWMPACLCECVLLWLRWWLRCPASPTWPAWRGCCAPCTPQLLSRVRGAHGCCGHVL